MNSIEKKMPAEKTNILRTGHMTHSISTPSGVDGTSTSRHRSGKKLTVRILMLDDSNAIFQVQAKAIGRVLFDQVCRQLSLLEADYFGLEYQEETAKTKYWLDLEKPLNRQIGLPLEDPEFRFCIKFYTPDPAQLEEEYTRYLFCLQIKRDLTTGNLQCNENTSALLASYIVQASCGDFVPEDYPDHTYLSSYKFVPHQDIGIQQKIMENHKKHLGQSPAEADLNLLETVRRCEFYGIKMHAAKDVEGVRLNLSVAHMGIAVFQIFTRINTFSWAKIRKISFKRKRFLVKLHPEGYGYYKDTVEFFFDGRNECKNFWKKCVENHGFFRCAAVQDPSKRKSKVLSRGSSFRYSGKTQQQIIEFIRENYVKRQTFQRSQSFRQGPMNASSRSQSHSLVNSSLSANPLLPINTAGWGYHNQSTESMTHSPTKKTTDSSLNHQINIHIDHEHSQVTAAQVQDYQMKSFVQELQNTGKELQNQSVVTLDQRNSNRYFFPQDHLLLTPTQFKPITKDQDQAHARQKDPSFSSSDEGLELSGLRSAKIITKLAEDLILHEKSTSRSNSPLHVCWHRFTTISLTDHLISADNQLSGYLLRKFKNSAGWQKLWVVFTSFCLYFYKSYKEEIPLASLPLLGYSIGPPCHKDSIQREFVFKLFLKNHKYFFRAESIYTYNRWLEALRSTTQIQDLKNFNMRK